MGAGYSGSSVGGPDGGAQMSLASRHSSILGSSQEADVGGYRALPSVSAHYGGQYSSIYGTAALSATQQVSGIWSVFLCVCFGNSYISSCFELSFLFKPYCRYL